MENNLEKQILKAFKTNFKGDPILVSAPGRINLIGEHTDYNDGFVFPAAIDKKIVAAFSESESEVCSVMAFDKNEIFSFDLEEIKRLEKGGWKNYVLGVVAEVLKIGKELKPFHLVFGGNIPEGSGMSSSAALENAVVFGLNELFQLGLSKKEMIHISQKAEHHYAGVKCGIMDQFASMFGQEDHALFLDCRTLESLPYKIDFQECQLVLINSNVTHNLAEDAYNERRSVCEKVASLLEIKALRDATEEDLKTVENQISEIEYLKALYIIQENARVEQSVLLLKENNLKAFGELLFEAHMGMKDQFKITCPEIDFLVDLAKENENVLGSRMMGGGFGGCTINIIKKVEVENFIEQTTQAYKKQFGLDCSVYFVKISNGTHLN